MTKMMQSDTAMKSAKPKLPKYIWADYDPEYPRDVRWSFYRTRSEQRGNRPDFKAIKLRIVLNDEAERSGGKRRSTSTTTEEKP
jgi:hypothetical protein